MEIAQLIMGNDMTNRTRSQRSRSGVFRGARSPAVRWLALGALVVVIWPYYETILFVGIVPQKGVEEIGRVFVVEDADA